MFTEWLNRSFSDDVKMAQHAHVITYVPAVNLDEGGGGGGGVSVGPRGPSRLTQTHSLSSGEKLSSSSFLRIAGIDGAAERQYRSLVDCFFNIQNDGSGSGEAF